MQMTTPVPSTTYLLPDPNRSSKSTLIKSPVPIPTAYHPMHPAFYPRSSQTNVHLTVRSAPVNESSSALTVANCHSDDSSTTTAGSGGHSLSQSMESINNIGLPDDEVK